MIGAVVELLGLVVIAGAAVGLVRSLRRVGTAVTTGSPAVWEPHVAAVDNHTVVSVRRGRSEVLEIARFAADDPDWHDKLVSARAEAAVRATELNAPY